jgi:hypothetical protein
MPLVSLSDSLESCSSADLVSESDNGGGGCEGSGSNAGESSTLPNDAVLCIAQTTSSVEVMSVIDGNARTYVEGLGDEIGESMTM